MSLNHLTVHLHNTNAARLPEIRIEINLTHASAVSLMFFFSGGAWTLCVRAEEAEGN
jgi:hypothetical protein